MQAERAGYRPGIDGQVISMITIPLFSGAIGYLTNWTGVWMLFNPLRFRGVRVPGLAALAQVLPRKLQEVPGVMHGGVGWQGIIPSRAAKMGSIAVDKGIAKLGSPSDFYGRLKPDSIAEHILASSERDIRDVVDRIMRREHPGLWSDLPARVREAVHERVRAQLPEIVHEVTGQIGARIDQLLDVKLMVIRHIEAKPELANRIFLAVGRKELRFIINFGFWFGLVLGVPVVFLVEALPYWWVLPIAGTAIGWTTNWLAIEMIFRPVAPRKVGPLRLHGLFLRRQREVADVYAGVIADDIVTVRNIGRELLHGPRSDRTRHMLETSLRPAVDRASGVIQPLVRVAVGPREYDAIRESVAAEAVEYTINPLADPEFNRAQSGAVREHGAELLALSADVEYEEELHPAYERILSQLAPDEARILRLLAQRGAQPAVDVRAGKALGLGSEMVASGLNMIGAEAGCRYVDRVPAYLNNLYRLGLIWFSREPLEDPLDYQGLEAQLDVIEAKRAGGRAKTVRRSIVLTPFGEDFCRVCLPLT